MTKLQKNLYFIGMMLAGFMFSVSNVAPGTLLSELQRHYNLSGFAQGLIDTVIKVGMIVAMMLLLTGILHIKKTLNILLALVFMSFSLLFLGTAPSYALLLVAFFFIGGAISHIDSLTSGLVTEIFSENPGFRLGCLHAAAGIGGSTGPLLIGALKNFDIKWNVIIFILGAVSTAILIFNILLYVFMHKTLDNSMHTPAVTSVRQNKAFFTPFSVLMMLAAAGNGAHQLVLVFWAAQYVEQCMDSVKLAPLAVSVFWVGTTISRLVVPLMRPKKIRRYVFIAMLTISAVMTIAMLSGNAVVFIAAVFVTGLMGGAVIPMIIVQLCEVYPQNTVFVSSAVLTCCYVMQMVGAAVSSYAAAISLPAAVSVSVISAFLSLIASLVAGCVSRARVAPPDSRSK